MMMMMMIAMVTVFALAGNEKSMKVIDSPVRQITSVLHLCTLSSSRCERVIYPRDFQPIIRAAQQMNENSTERLCLLQFSDSLKPQTMGK